MKTVLHTKDSIYRECLPGGARIAGKESNVTWNSQQNTGRSGEEQVMPMHSAELSTAPNIDLQPQCMNNNILTDTKFNTGNNRNVGYTGLSNIGNTCFMNCVLQALANFRELRDFFLSSNFMDDINEDNPLGTRGRLAQVFCTALKHLWSGQDKPYAPVKLRSIVASLAPQFLGIMQQDAQEFMAFFLDALHEDLNRVRNKPVFEIGSHDNQPDYSVAKKMWDLHQSRNDSFIVDKFHGMYKSKLTCPSCKKESVTFDPFLFLSVPLPKPMQVISVVFLSMKYDYEILHTDVKVYEEGGITAELLNKVAERHSIKSENLRIFEVESGKVMTEFIPSDPTPVMRFSSSLVVYDVTPAEDMNGENYVFILQTVEVPEDIDTCSKCKKCSSESGCKIRRCTKCRRVGYCNQECQKSDWSTHKSQCTQRPFISCPLLINISCSKTTYQNLSSILRKHVKYTISINEKKNIDMGSGQRFDCMENSMTKKDVFQGQSGTHFFNIFLGNEDNIDNLIQVHANNDEIDLTDVTHIVMEWKSSVLAVGKSIKYGARSKKHCDPLLQDCIELFTHPEVLAAEEAWYCPNCKKHREATKELSLWHLPDILVIQLKRFSFRNRLWRDKIDKLVNFPINGLDMRPFCINQGADHPIYDLFAVINHHGGLFGGHYTSYVRLTDETDTDSDLGWRLCDDSHVTSVRSDEDVVTSSAYVVFYQKRKQTVFDGKSSDNEIWHSAEDLSTPNGFEKQETEVEQFDHGDIRYISIGEVNSGTNKKSVTTSGVTSTDQNVSVDEATIDMIPEISSVEIGSGETTIESSCKDNKEILGNTSDNLLYTDMDAID